MIDVIVGAVLLIWTILAWIVIDVIRDERKASKEYENFLKHSAPVVERFLRATRESREANRDTK